MPVQQCRNLVEIHLVTDQDARSVAGFLQDIGGEKIVVRPLLVQMMRLIERDLVQVEFLHLEAGAERSPLIPDFVGIGRIQRIVAWGPQEIDLVHIEIGFFDGLHHGRPFGRLVDIDHLGQDAVVVDKSSARSGPHTASRA